jgi:MraZ protein
MTHFLGTFTSRLDKKGRVSVPASFRAALERLGTDELIFRPSHTHPCVEAWPAPFFAALSDGLNTLDAFSDAHDEMAMALFSEACPLRPDGEGRIVLPESLIVHGGLGEAVCFVGVGRTFQMWEPAAAKRRMDEARERARARGLTVPAPNPGRPT